MSKNNLNKNDQQNENMNNSQNEKKPDANAKKGYSLFNVIMVIVLITMVFNIITNSFLRRNKIETTYNQFLELVESGNVSEVQISDSEISFIIPDEASQDNVKEILLISEKEKAFLKEGDINFSNNIYVTGPINDPDLKDTLLKNDVKFSKSIVEAPSIWSVILSWILPFVIMYFIYYLFTRSMRKRMGNITDSMGGDMGGVMGNITKSQAKEYEMDDNVKIKFSDVAGQDEAKESLEEMIDFLHNPDKYKNIGAKQPKGALLVGPPGTGKTMLAKAVAGEAKVPFYHLSGSEFIEMFVGVGAKRVRDLFETANKNSPAIIFIDEIDAIGKKRDNQMGSNDEREQTLNQLLAEMDGFDSAKGIIILAATNRPEILDKALLRPGRFDRQIPIELPDLPGREAILKVHAKNIKKEDHINLRDIALATNGASGADLANMVNEAALRAVKMGRERVIQEDLMESVEVVIAGQEKKDRVMNQKEREMVAYHEVGHALVTALQKNSQPVHKITIVPRTKGALGYTMSISEEERYLLTKEELLSEINSLMGGRAAEIVKFGVQTTGASNDIERATKMARNMVTMYGMSDTFGPMSMESVENKYLDGRNVSNVSEQTNTLVDSEVQKILQQSQNEAITLLENNMEALERISIYLLEKENITGKEFMDLLEKE